MFDRAGVVQRAGRDRARVLSIDQGQQYRRFQACECADRVHAVVQPTEASRHEGRTGHQQPDAPAKGGGQRAVSKRAEGREQ